MLSKANVFILSLAIAMLSVVSSFSVLRSSPNSSRRLFDLNKSTFKLRTLMHMQSENPADFGQLTSALARLDSEWQQQQKSPNTKKNPTWRKLYVPKGDATETPENDDISNDQKQIPSEFVYYLPPQKSPEEPPSSIILFLGGAALGQYPHITYSSLLTRLSKKTNAAIFAAPYSVQLDHFDLAKKSGDLLRRALIQFEDGKFSDIPQYDSNHIADIPKYALCHSLGAKLQLIFTAATDYHINLKGIGIMAFNNYGFADSIKMAQSFLTENTSKQFQQQMPFNMNSEMFDSIFQFAETAINMVGIEFTPSPSQMENLLQLKFTSEVQQKCRLFTFDDDDLDCTPSLSQCAKKNSDLAVSKLAGTHLSPVYLQFGIKDLEIEEDMRDVVGQFTNDIQQISWGDETHLDSLVDEINNWMMGKPPSIRGNSGLLLGVVDAEID